jgi:hypothetical protein
LFTYTGLHIPASEFQKQNTIIKMPSATMSSPVQSNATSWIAEEDNRNESRIQPWQKWVGEKVDTGLENVKREDIVVVINIQVYERLLGNLIDI